VCAIVVFIGRFSLWNFQVLDWAFPPLHADVWSEDSCRRNGTVRLLPAAWRGVKFFLRVPATVSWRAGLRGASSCQGLRVARVSFLVRVFAGL